MRKKQVVLIIVVILLTVFATYGINSWRENAREGKVLDFVWDNNFSKSVEVVESHFVEPGFIGQNEGLAVYLKLIMNSEDLHRLIEYYEASTISFGLDDPYEIAQLKYSSAFEERFNLSEDELDLAYPLFKIAPGRKKLFPVEDHPENFRLCYLSVDTETSPTLEVYLYCPGKW